MKSMDEKEFNRLLKHCRDSQACFNRLYRFYFPKIVFYINDTFATESMGQDVAQDFFTKLLVMEKLPDHVKYPTWWIMRCCDNIAINMIGKRDSDRRRAAVACEKRTDDGTRLLDPRLTDMRELVKTLDALTGRIVEMHVCQGYGFRELSVLLNVGYATVRQRFFRGLKKMREVDLERSREVPE